MANIAQTVFPDLAMTARHEPSEVEKEVHKSQVRWTICLERGRQKFETAYSTGIGHLQGYKQGMEFRSVDEREALKQCLLTGSSRPTGGGPHLRLKSVPPKLDDVLSCLIMDSDVIDYSSFEDWANSIGYDTDSREAERIYNACLKIALSLRQMFGEEGLRKLRMAFNGETENGEQTGDIRDSGMGGFLNPPTHPEHKFSVQIGHDSSLSLSSAAENENLDDETRAKAKKLLDEWQPLPLTHPDVGAWVRQVLGYFKHMYRNPSLPEPECWHVDMMLAEKSRTDKEMLQAGRADDHAGVHLIRKWYPDFMPTEADFEHAKWGD